MDDDLCSQNTPCIYFKNYRLIVVYCVIFFIHKLLHIYFISILLISIEHYVSCSPFTKLFMCFCIYFRNYCKFIFTFFVSFTKYFIYMFLFISYIFCIYFKSYHRFIYFFEYYSINILLTSIDYHIFISFMCRMCFIDLEKFLKFFINIFHVLLVSSNPSFTP